MAVSLSILDAAKEKMLQGDFSLAGAYYSRARSEGTPPDIVNLRYLTKNYLVYPIEYQDSCAYFSTLLQLKNLVSRTGEYLEEYQLALGSLLNLKQLFLRSISLFYFSDIEITPRNSVVVRQIAELLSYLRQHKLDILSADIYDIRVHFPGTNMQNFTRDLNIIEAYCMNLLLSYTAVQDQAYMGKTYSALTVDYGSFATTDITVRNRYLKWAVLKPRFFVIGGEAYYDDLLRDYHLKLRELGNFDAPKSLRKELTDLINHNYSKTENKDFFEYAKHFEKEDSSRTSLFQEMNSLANILNPFNRLNFIANGLSKDRVCSFELDTYFRRKMIWGVCDMLASGQGWNIKTVRWCMLLSCCLMIGPFVYAALMLAMKLGFYWGIEIQKH